MESGLSHSSLLEWLCRLRLASPLPVESKSVYLLEIGASAGLNLLADRFAYVVGGELLGEPASPVRFEEPWRGAPVHAVSPQAHRLGSAVQPSRSVMTPPDK